MRIYLRLTLSCLGGKMKEIEVMVASHRKTQAIRKKLEIIIKRIQSQQETAWELQGALKKILHNERIYCS